MTQFMFPCSYIVRFPLTRTVDGISAGWLLPPCFSRTLHQVVASMSPPLEPGGTSVAVQPAAEQLQREGHKNARCCRCILLTASHCAGKEPPHGEEPRPPPAALWAPRHSHADERALTLLSTRSMRPFGALPWVPAVHQSLRGIPEVFLEQGTSAQVYLPHVRKASEAANHKTGRGIPGRPTEAEAQLRTHSRPLHCSPRPRIGPALS